MKRSVFIMLLIAILILGCETKKTEEHEAEETKPVLSGKLEIKNPWIRAAAKGMNTAFFFEVVNGTDKPDTIYGALSDLAEITEVHETFRTDDDRMGMREVEALEIKSGETLQFKPRSYHVMLIKLKNDLPLGSEGSVTLKFKNAGEISVTAEVKEMPSMMKQN
jgi:copper(I)-binding protein